MVFVFGSLNTRATRAGASASFAKRSGSGDQGTMSIRSPPSSFTTACTREPFRPTHAPTDRKSTRLNSSHSSISYAVFCLKKKKKKYNKTNKHDNKIIQ